MTRGVRDTMTRVRIWLRRYGTRRQLRRLAPHLLDDIGLSEAQRRRECAKWFWQA